jgi:hypothetical protein
MPKARNRDPQTSFDAANSISQERVTETQRAIYYLLLASSEGSTDVEGWRFYQLAMAKEVAPYASESGYRSRRAELVNLGLVEDTGERVKLPSGRKAIVWKSVNKATALLR